MSQEEPTSPVELEEFETVDELEVLRAERDELRDLALVLIDRFIASDTERKSGDS